MSRAGGGPAVRVIAPALLVVGVIAATLLFLRAQPAPPAGPPSPASPGPAGSAADAAHAAGGIQMGAGAGDVAARFQQQVEAMQAQIHAAPSARQLILRLAQLLHDGHRVEDALPLYRQAMTLDPTDPQPYYDLASAYAGMGDWDAAAQVLEDLLDQKPGDAVALFDLGAVWANQGRTVEARRLMEQAQQASTDATLRARASEALARLRGQ